MISGFNSFETRLEQLYTGIVDFIELSPVNSQASKHSSLCVSTLASNIQLYESQSKFGAMLKVVIDSGLAA